MSRIFWLISAILCLYVSMPIPQVNAQDTILEKQRWQLNGERLVYGIDQSDITEFVAICSKRSGQVKILVDIRPKSGKFGDKTPITFQTKTEKRSYTATLTELDGISGTDVKIDLPLSAKLFDLLEGGETIIAQVKGAQARLPPFGTQRGDASRAFRKACAG